MSARYEIRDIEIRFYTGRQPRPRGAPHRERPRPTSAREGVAHGVGGVTRCSASNTDYYVSVKRGQRERRRRRSPKGGALRHECGASSPSRVQRATEPGRQAPGQQHHDSKLMLCIVLVWGSSYVLRGQVNMPAPPAEGILPPQCEGL